MIRNFNKVCNKKAFLSVFNNRTFLTNEYKCAELWNSINSSPVLNNINLNDFYNQLEQNYSSKGVISAIDIDIFANAIKEPGHLEELKDLLIKLRLSAETGNMLESTQHATVRNFIKYGYIKELIEIIKDPLNFGVFLDDYSANILLNELLKEQNYEWAASIASAVMLQEDFNNEITCTLCQYACYKYIIGYVPPEPVAPPEEKKKKVEEFKIRIKFLRNPYFDDHFDIKDTITLSAKTLAWISERATDNLNNNLQIIGWMMYKKYDKVLALCENLKKSSSFKVYPEVMNLLNELTQKVKGEAKSVFDQCISILNNIEQTSTEVSLESSLKTAIENAINSTQKNDIVSQEKLYKSWTILREEKLKEQMLRLDRAKRLQVIEEKQKDLQKEEQKLWFFENEEQIDLEIEKKEELTKVSSTKSKVEKTTDENYVPPEIRPKRK